MKRRAFIAALGGAAALPLAVRAQQTERVRSIGVLTNFEADDAEGTSRLAAFSRGLQDFGWTVGRNVQLHARWAAADAERFRRYAAELVALSPDVIVASASPAIMALQQAGYRAPIVFVAVADPVGGGFVENLARPGGNATGFTQFEYGISTKWLDLLKE